MGGPGVTSPHIDGASTPTDEAMAFEALLVATVTGAVARAVGEVVELIIAAHGIANRTHRLSPSVARVLARLAATRLRGLVWAPMVPLLRLHAAGARDFGQERATRDLPPADVVKVTARPWRSDHGLPTVPDIDRGLRDKLHEGARLASTLDMARRSAVLAVAGRARSGVAVAKSGARWAANEGINAGTAHVATVTGKRLVWVAERNACLHCLARAGWAVVPGEPFPGGLSFDPASREVRAVPWPPLHPNCRCEVRTYDGPAGKPGSRSLSDDSAALAREARRSVALQFSDHASGAAARRAASALLRAGADLPASVRTRARNALRSGQPPRRPR